MDKLKKIYKAIIFIYNHSLVKNERLGAFIRYIRFHLTYRNGEQCKIPLLDKSLLIVKGEGNQGHLYTYLADFEEMMFLLHYLNKEDFFIDIGANIGSYSILASSQIGCKTLAFEPSKENYTLLSSNIKLNDLQDFIISHNYALGEFNSSSLIKYNGAMSHIVNNHKSQLQQISIKKLDDFANYGELIKIDVEGYEEFVLKGAEAVLKNERTNALIVELGGYRHNRYGSSNDEIHKILSKNNFIPYKYNPYNRMIDKLATYRCNQFNTIYIRDDKIAEERLISSPKYKIGNKYI